MFKIAKIVKYDDLMGEKLKELESWTDNKFYLNFEVDGKLHNEFNYKHKLELKRSGDIIKKNCPDSLGEAMFYIRHNTEYHYLNHIGRYCLYHVWPLFFEKFPLGQIWIIETGKSWYEEIWDGQKELAEKYNPNNPISAPQEMTGLQIDSFPINALNILAYGIYPLILCSFVSLGAFNNLTFIYIPDRAFRYSQMMEANTLFNKSLWDIHHVFDDQWTFDGSRGAKSGIDAVLMNPINQIEYFEWFINKINDRMTEILQIEDPLLREKVVMTANRLIFDAQLSVTNELPYISKVFFFNFLDKLANIMRTLKNKKINEETQEWKILISEDFLCKNVLENTIKIPNKVGDHLNEIIKFVVKEMKYGDLNPEYFRDLRNTNHGYNVTPNSIPRLMEHDGEINNDIPLITTPLIMYLFSLKWKIYQK